MSIADQGFRVQHYQQGDTNGSQGYSSGNGGQGQGSPSPTQSLEGNINEHIAVALVRLQQDMNDVLNRLNALEANSRQGQPVKEANRNKNRVSKCCCMMLVAIIGVERSVKLVSLCLAEKRLRKILVFCLPVFSRSSYIHCMCHLVTFTL